MAKGTFDLKAWALVGAQQRLRELDQERAAIFSAFPQLRSGAPGRRPGRPKAAGGTEAAGVAAPVMKRKRRKMSKEARAKIGAAQRARWAKQKKAEGKTAAKKG